MTGYRCRKCGQRTYGFMRRIGDKDAYCNLCGARKRFKRMGRMKGERSDSDGA